MSIVVPKRNRRGTILSHQAINEAIANIQQPTLVVFGEQSSSISREGKSETVPERLEAYTSHLPKGQGSIIPGRNVLPYESTAKFVGVVSNFNFYQDC